MPGDQAGAEERWDPFFCAVQGRWLARSVGKVSREQRVRTAPWPVGSWDAEQQEPGALPQLLSSPVFGE